MQSLFISITEHCNRFCMHCFSDQGVGQRSNNYLSLATLVSSLEKLKDAPFIMYLTGGEPLLHPQLGEIIHFLKRRAVVILLTNGDLLTAGTFTTLKGMEQVIISLKSTDNAYLREMQQKVKALRENAINVSSIFVVTRQNMSEIKPLLEFTQKLLLPLLIQPAYISPAHPQFGSLSLWKLDEQEWLFLDSLMSKYLLAEGSASYYRFWKSFYHGQVINPPFCQMGNDCLVMDVAGNHLTCFHQAGQSAPFPACFGEHCLSLFTYL
ncbi:radical SAM protein [candidate division CSSED10-310 bacterium]|uniref:Radical SAM protein n=1 Tax=candidate division CSSED10-310 bacterium TaxID=2855610 RepID=A0ABV6YYY7_UNCC1